LDELNKILLSFRLTNYGDRDISREDPKADHIVFNTIGPKRKVITVSPRNEVNVGTKEPIDSFQGIILRSRAFDTFKIFEKDYSLGGHQEYIVKGSINSKSIELIPTNPIAIVQYNTYTALDKKIKELPINELLSAHSLQYISYKESQYEEILHRELNLSTLAGNNTEETEGVLIDVRYTTILGLDLDSKDPKFTTSLIEFICKWEWKKCYIYSSSTTGIHAYLTFTHPTNCIEIFKSASVICGGFKAWIKASGFQVMRRNYKKDSSKDSAIRQIAYLEHNSPASRILYPNIQPTIDPFLYNSRHINLRSYDDG